jgi:lipoprotein Spr
LYKRILLNGFLLLMASCFVACNTTKKSTHSAVAKASTKKQHRSKKASKNYLNNKPIVAKQSPPKPRPIYNQDVERKPRPSSVQKIELKNDKKFENYICEKYAAQLNVEKKDIKGNLELFKYIDLFMGTPYKYGSMELSGTDCSGFTKNMYKLNFQFDLGRDAGAQYAQCKPINKSQLKEGDLVFFKIGGKRISHVGLYLANGKFVHASTRKGVIISSLEEDYYKKYFFSGGRVKM